jgi:hypothetical protein
LCSCDEEELPDLKFSACLGYVLNSKRYYGAHQDVVDRILQTLSTLPKYISLKESGVPIGEKIQVDKNLVMDLFVTKYLANIVRKVCFYNGTGIFFDGEASNETEIDLNLQSLVSCEVL